MEDKDVNALVHKWIQIEGEFPGDVDDYRNEAAAAVSKRWADCLELLDFMIEESKLSFLRIMESHLPKAKKETDWRYEAMSRTYGQCINAGLEISTLLRNGFADRAFASWRTMHELVIVLGFLGRHDAEMADRFRNHFWIANYKMALLSKEHEVALGRPISDEVLSKNTNLRNELVDLYGEGYAEDYGWANPAFADRTDRNGKIRRVTFSDLEKLMENEPARVYYRFASFRVHATGHSMLSQLSWPDIDRSAVRIGPTPHGLELPGGYSALHLGTAAKVMQEHYPDPMKEFDGQAFEDFSIALDSRFNAVGRGEDVPRMHPPGAGSHEPA